MKKTVLIILTLVALFILRLQFIPKLNLHDGDRIRVTGILNNEPQVSGNSQNIKLGQFSFWAPKYPEFHYGDKVEVVGKVKVIPLISSKLSFNRYSIEAESIKGITSDVGIKSIKGLAIRLKSSLINVFNKIYPKPYDGIISGIVIGDKSLIPKEFWDKLKAVGTLHIMVASGTNVVFIGNGLLSILLILFKRRISLLILIPLIWFYALVTGFEAPVIRSAIMLSLFYVSQIFGKESERGRVLLMTGFIMLMFDPLLLFNIGFQLSFLATAGLVWIQPKMKLSSRASETSRGIPFLERKREGFLHSLRSVGMTIGQGENFTSTFSAQLATLPILVFAFGTFNLLSPIVNLLILWTIPYVLEIGVFVGILGLLWLNLAKVTGYLAIPILLYIEQITIFFAKIIRFQVRIPEVGWGLVVVYYVVLWWWVKNENKQ